MMEYKEKSCRDDYGIKTELEKKKGEDQIKVLIERDAELRQAAEVNGAGVSMLVEAAIYLSVELASAENLKRVGVDKFANNIADTVSRQVRVGIIERCSEIVAEDWWKQMNAEGGEE